MKPIFTPLHKFVVSIFILLSLISCQKEIDNTPANNPDNTVILPDLISRINASASGFVTNENDEALVGANVSFGTASAVTDKYGYFEFSNVSVVKEAAVVTVEKNGYFPGIKTFRAETGKSGFFRIKLIPKTNAGSISATTGGSISLSNGLSVSLPASGVVNASNNQPYLGNINVSASWINPTAKDLDLIMPGDLRGINSNGGMSGLITFGMCAVELTGTGGEKLQIAVGKQATLTFPIPASMSAVAPASIPLWYFDENKGLWKEEGRATKTGNSYVGQVNHFSFWNCDVPDEYVNFNCTLLDHDGDPISFAYVKMTEVSNPYNTRGGFTNDSGYVSGIVPANTILQLEVYANYYQGCATPVYTETITTATSNLAVSITIPSTVLLQADISGTATDCNALPLTSGYVIMFDGHYHYRHTLDNLGQFSFSKVLCDNATNVTFIVEDQGTSQQSSSFPFTLSAGPNVIPAIQACGTSTSEFINYTINGAAYSITTTDSLFMFTNPQATPPRIEIHGNTNISTNPTFTSNISFGISSAGIAAGSTQSLTMFYTTDIPEQHSISSPIDVHITEYGNVGEFIAGNFTGIMTGVLTNYNVTCTFRKRRTQ